eukprot:CAMPEP_0197915246 /NCGR_PEP_ID=MMETSP1439-20131203/79887_1 /TAXON_ID=66791 /ORGANISM="Gonyaulax spinifera, Strain CCMP409" /LENGTH=49 /DNA_ID= /DNA_START= /DNA_END= /DNA_ORIENTATION=
MPGRFRNGERRLAPAAPRFRLRPAVQQCPCCGHVPALRSPMQRAPTLQV